jgi:hypothetical protein
VLIGKAVGFHINVLLLPGDDDIASVPANVDDIAKIGRGEVIEVAKPMLLQCALPTPRHVWCS